MKTLGLRKWKDSPLVQTAGVADMPDVRLLPLLWWPVKHRLVSVSLQALNLHQTSPLSWG
jgi:hypothetical protein